MADTVTFVIMLVAFSAVMIYIGYRGYKATKGATDWLVAGRRVGAWVVALSYGATFISAVAIIGFGGQAQVLSLIHISEPTRLGMISYAVFCLKKKKEKK